jgi:1-deoxy-D-xylulose-5-phosphate synthase
LLDRGLKVRTMVLPDTFIAQDKPERMYELAGLSADGIVATVLGALDTNHQPVQRVGVGFRLH